MSEIAPNSTGVSERSQGSCGSAWKQQAEKSATVAAAKPCVERRSCEKLVAASNERKDCGEGCWGEASAKVSRRESR